MKDINTRLKKKLKTDTAREEKGQDCVFLSLDKEIWSIILSMVVVFYFEAFKRTSKMFRNIYKVHSDENSGLPEMKEWVATETFLYNERNPREEYIRWAIENKVLKIANRSLETIAELELLDVLKMIIEDFKIIDLQKEKQMAPYDGVPKIMSDEETNRHFYEIQLERTMIIDVPKIAARYGNLSIIQYIDDRVESKDKKGSWWIMYGRSTWNPFLRNFGFHKIRKSYIEIAAYHGHVPILEWALEKKYIDRENIMKIVESTAKGGQVEVVKWLDNCGHLSKTSRFYLINTAITSDSVELFRWMHERFKFGISENSPMMQLIPIEKNIAKYIQEQEQKHKTT